MPKCYCTDCQGVRSQRDAYSPQTMSTCTDCGDKHCPKALNHRN